MKRFCAVVLMLLLLFAVSCQEAGKGSVAKSNEDMSSPYREKSFLSFLVKRLLLFLFCGLDQNVVS